MLMLDVNLFRVIVITILEGLRMNWKFRLLFIITAIATAAFLINMPFQTDSTAQILSNDDFDAVIREKVTVYENGVMKTVPSNFAV